MKKYIKQFARKIRNFLIHIISNKINQGGGLNYLHTYQRLQEIADCQVVCIGEDYGVQNLQKLGKLGIYNNNP